MMCVFYIIFFRHHTAFFHAAAKPHTMHQLNASAASCFASLICFSRSAEFATVLPFGRPPVAFSIMVDCPVPVVEESSDMLVSASAAGSNVESPCDVSSPVNDDSPENTKLEATAVMFIVVVAPSLLIFLK